MSNSASDPEAWLNLRQRIKDLVASGRTDPIEVLLTEHPELRSQEQLLLDCIYAEFCVREERNLTPQPTEYLKRFPEYVGQLRAMFNVHAALDTPSLMDGMADSTHPSGDKPSEVDLHETVLPKDRAAQFASMPAKPTDKSSSRQIGPYKLLQKIGEGGMGAVYMADQISPVRRRVALKLIKSGMDSKQVVARFEAERQALAMMDHQNIAKVLDAGITEDGTPYFAMELVQGMPITKYCDREKLSIADRLQLFVQVCRAIQHAHQKGVIHRDIKPTNVLVTQRDGVPVAKVIDFGLAKALQSEHRLTDKTLFTEVGQVCGTLEYMSPEQAEMNELGLDTRTDVYSLGVLLYELLTGSTPLGHERVRKAAFHRVLELIRDEETPRPSRRLSESGDAITGISEQRRIEPRRLSGILKRELDWIALKALEKDRNRRYDGAGTLADDVQNYLDGDVVTARPPSTGYRLRKAIRKHKAGFVTFAVAFVLLIGGVLGTSTMWLRARSAETAALAEAVRARDAEAKERISRADVEDERDKAETAKMQAEKNLVAARQAVDQFFTTVSESQLLNNLDLQDLRRDLLQHAQRYYSEFVDRNMDDPSLRAELAAAHFRVAQTAIKGDVLSSMSAIASVNAGLTIVEQLIRETKDSSDWGSLTDGIYKGRLRRDAGYEGTGLPKPVALLVLPGAKRACAVWKELVQINPDTVGMQNDLAGLYNIQGLVQDSAGLDEEAAVSFHSSIEIWNELHRSYPQDENYPSDLAIAYANLAELYVERIDTHVDSENLEHLRLAIQWQTKTAELQRSLVVSNPSNSFFVMDLAGTCRIIGELNEKRGDLKEARRHYLEADQLLESRRQVVSSYEKQRAAITSRLKAIETTLKSLPTGAEAEP